MKNLAEIRLMLCEEIQSLREKKTTPANVNAIVNATGKIMSTIKLELEYAKLMNREPDNEFVKLKANALELTPPPSPPSQAA